MLKAAAQSAQGVPADDASAPTITASATTDAALTVNYPLVNAGAIANADKYLAIGGSPLLFNSNGNLGFKGATVTSGNLQNTNQQNAVVADIETASPTIEFRIFPQNTSRVRVLTKEPGQPWKYAVAGGAVTVLQSSTALSFVKIAYSGAMTGRRTRLEIARTDGDTANPGGVITNIRLASGYTALTPVDTLPKVAGYGDSITEAAKAGFHGDGYLNVVSWQLGWNPTQAAVGGTGYIQTGGNPNFQQRLDDLLLQAFGAVVVAGGTNDVGQTQADVTTAENAVFDGIRSGLPTKPVSVIGPWDLEAPSAMSSGRVLVRQGILAAVTGRAGFYWLDPTGIAFVKDADNVHPTKAGMVTLATWLNTQIRPSPLPIAAVLAASSTSEGAAFFRSRVGKWRSLDHSVRRSLTRDFSSLTPSRHARRI